MIYIPGSGASPDGDGVEAVRPCVTRCTCRNLRWSGGVALCRTLRDCYGFLRCLHGFFGPDASRGHPLGLLKAEKVARATRFVVVTDV